MATLKCANCESTKFVLDGEQLICRTCGTHYTAEQLQDILVPDAEGEEAVDDAVSEGVIEDADEASAEPKSKFKVVATSKGKGATANKSKKYWLRDVEVSREAFEMVFTMAHLDIKQATKSAKSVTHWDTATAREFVERDVPIIMKTLDDEDRKLIEDDVELFRKAKDPRGAQLPGCYVATAVYGSYDCPEVWTLRRFRDDTLAASLPGRAFIKAYYAVSPTVVKWFGDTRWFNRFWRRRLDKMVANLRAKGVSSEPYYD